MVWVPRRYYDKLMRDDAAWEDLLRERVQLAIDNRQRQHTELVGDLERELGDLRDALRRAQSNLDGKRREQALTYAVTFGSQVGTPGILPLAEKFERYLGGAEQEGVAEEPSDDEPEWQPHLFPYVEGGYRILGPGVFHDVNDKSVVSIEGENYVPQSELRSLETCTDEARLVQLPVDAAKPDLFAENLKASGLKAGAVIRESDAQSFQIGAFVAWTRRTGEGAVLDSGAGAIVEIDPFHEYGKTLKLNPGASRVDYVWIDPEWITLWAAPEED